MSTANYSVEVRRFAPGATDPSRVWDAPDMLHPDGTFFVYLDNPFDEHDHSGVYSFEIHVRLSHDNFSQDWYFDTSAALYLRCTPFCESQGYRFDEDSRSCVCDSLAELSLDVDVLGNINRGCYWIARITNSSPVAVWFGPTYSGIVGCGNSFGSTECGPIIGQNELRWLDPGETAQVCLIHCHFGDVPPDWPCNLTSLRVIDVTAHCNEREIPISFPPWDDVLGKCYVDDRSYCWFNRLQCDCIGGTFVPGDYDGCY